MKCTYINGTEVFIDTTTGNLVMHTVDGQNLILDRDEACTLAETLRDWLLQDE